MTGNTTKNIVGKLLLLSHQDLINDILSHSTLGVLAIGRLRSTVLQVVYSLKLRQSA